MRETSQYVDLITPFFRGRPKFTGTVAGVVDILSQLQKFIVDNIPSCFDVDTAIGVQLDKTGQWIGRDRNLLTPITDAYFSFSNTPPPQPPDQYVDPPSGLGFDHAVWAGPYSPTDQITALDDNTYRCLLYAKIEANNSDGTIATIEKIYSDFIACCNPIPGTNLYVEDKQDMSMVIGLTGHIPPVLYWELMTTQFVPVKPAGVELYFVTTSVEGHPNFGFDVQNQYISGFDDAPPAAVQGGSWGTIVII
jgi:hypothetical protein